LTSLHTLSTSRDWPLIVEWHTLLRLFFAPPRRRAAKLTSSHVSILTCEKWYWDRELTWSDWKYRKTEYWGKHFYLHWIYNKIIHDLKMTTKQPEYRTVWLRSFEFQLYKENFEVVQSFTMFLHAIWYILNYHKDQTYLNAIPKQL